MHSPTDTGLLKKQLAEVRKELADKTLLLSRSDQNHKADHERQAEEQADNLERTHQLQVLQHELLQLQALLQHKSQELEDTQRLHAVQKRALKDALVAAADKEASMAVADEMKQAATHQALEDEVEFLAEELQHIKTRADLQLKAKDAAISMLRAQLESHQAEMSAALHALQQEHSSHLQAALDGCRAESMTQLQQLQAELSWLRDQSDQQTRTTNRDDISCELASLTKAKLQLQHEFEAFKDMATETSRSNREELTRLLQENAHLKARIAADAASAAMGLPAGSKRMMLVGKTFTARPSAAGDLGLIDHIVNSLERRSKGLTPLLIMLALVLLVLVVTVIRAAASAAGSDHGGLCFLFKLGINIGSGCQHTTTMTHHAASHSTGARHIRRLLHEAVA
eukprot:jgi/Chrzof1/8886/Cz03g27290.t1